MKILHTSDWHLGHRLYEQSQFEEQLAFLHWLEDTIQAEQIDVLLVSGDIFDNGVPATQSQKLYYDFLIRLRDTCCKHIVITGGNHDAPGTINAPKELLHALNIHVVGKAPENVEDEVFKLTVNEEKVIVAAVPYLRDMDIRRAVAGESFDEIGTRYKMALINHYQMVASYIKNSREADTPVVAMGHLFAIGGSTSDSEQTIYVGKLGDIGAEDFPEIFDYVALGHLHRPQKAGGENHIRYSGSPYKLSFSEINYDKKVVLIETNQSGIEEIKEIDVPCFRKLFRIEGTLDSCIAELNMLNRDTYELTPWAEVVVDTSNSGANAYAEIMRATENLSIEVLKVASKHERKMAGLEQLIQNTKHVKELSPMEVFNIKCREMEFDLEENPELLDAFSEVLQLSLNEE